MNQFIIENPVFSIVIAFIIGAVIMNITSALTVRMAVEKEVTKALVDEEDTRVLGASARRVEEGDYGKSRASSYSRARVGNQRELRDPACYVGH